MVPRVTNVPPKKWEDAFYLGSYIRPFSTGTLVTLAIRHLLVVSELLL